MGQMSAKPATEPIQILVDASVRPLYTNLALISHTRREFILDFLMQTRGEARLLVRLVTSPGHAKKLAEVLSGNVRGYEEHFGRIEDDVEEPKPRAATGGISTSAAPAAGVTLKTGPVKKRAKQRRKRR